MSTKLPVAALLLTLGVTPSQLAGQLSFRNQPIQIHGFASQGFVASHNKNNYLTMNTSGGSFEFTDGGLNVGIPVSDRLRIGGQVYMRNIGELGQWRPTLDWAVADYKFNDRIGIRGGKVKTVLGLYNDSQDTNSLHTWAILPQSLYPLDLRSSTLAHLGGDVYGDIPVGSSGSAVQYTGFLGTRFDDKYGGYRNVAREAGARLHQVTGWMTGADLRWNNVQPGLTVGTSWIRMPFAGSGTHEALNLPIRFEVAATSAIVYVEYVRDNLRVVGELSRNLGVTTVTGLPTPMVVDGPQLGWYTSLAYRVHRNLELGTYHSRFVPDTNVDWGSESNHIRDQAFTARIDITRSWTLKIEGHMIDGYGNPYSARGFYLKQNPSGMAHKTNLLVLRTGYTF